VDQITEKLPYAADAERAVLGAMLVSREALETATEKLQRFDDAFYLPAYREIFASILSLAKTGLPVDQFTLAEQLRKSGSLEKIGGEDSLSALVLDADVSGNVKHHCNIVLEKAKKRRLMAIFAEAGALCKETGSTLTDVIAGVQNQLQSLETVAVESRSRAFKDIMLDAYGWLAEKAQASGPMGISSGIPRLNKNIDGWQKDRLYIIAAKTGKGKSALALNFALNASLGQHPTLVFSLEMGDIEVGVRALSSTLSMDLSEIQYKKPNDKRWTAILNASAMLGERKIFVNDTPGLSIDDMSAEIRRMKREHGIEMVIVDYLQLMEGKRTNSREQEVASISRGLKLLAKAHHIPVVALSQFSRKADDKDSEEPQLSWLRESGSIEHDADVVIFIHEPSEDAKTNYKVDEDRKDLYRLRELIVKKNRGGKVGKVIVVWKEESLTFREAIYSKSQQEG
jgi:replicative DNA helicase